MFNLWLRHLPVLMLVALLATGCSPSAFEPLWYRPDRDLGRPIQVAMDACTRETGDHGTGHKLWGYSEAFMACMKARGWAAGSRTHP
jgi:hypothetical protein